MTVVENDRRYEYAGNGATVAFNGPKLFEADHLSVYLVNDDTLAEELLTEGADYTLSGVGDQQCVVTLDTAAADGITVRLLRTVPYTQETSIRNQGAFLPEIHEDEFDLLMMAIQQLADLYDQLDDRVDEGGVDGDLFVRIDGGSTMTGSLKVATAERQVQLFSNEGAAGTSQFFASFQWLDGQKVASFGVSDNNDFEQAGDYWNAIQMFRSLAGTEPANYEANRLVLEGQIQHKGRTGSGLDGAHLHFLSDQYMHGAVRVVSAVPTVIPPDMRNGDSIWVTAEVSSTALRFAGAPIDSVVGVAYAADLNPTGGTAPLTVEVVSGSTLVPVDADGEMELADPDAPGTYSFTARVTDDTGATVDRMFQYTIADPDDPPPETFAASGSWLNGYVGLPYSCGGRYDEGLVATPTNYRAVEVVLTGTHPPGLSVSDPRNTMLGGWPTTAATYTFDAEVYEILAFGLLGSPITVAQSVIISATPANTVWNPRDRGTDGGVKFHNGAAPMLTVEATGDADLISSNGIRSICGKTTGLFYVEFTIDALGSDLRIGIDASDVALGSIGLVGNGALNQYAYQAVASSGLTGTLRNSSGGSTSVGVPIGLVGGKVGVALNATTGKIWFRYDGTWIGGGDPAAGTGENFTVSIPGSTTFAEYRLVFSGADGAKVTLNSGETAFTHAAPAGFGDWTLTAPTDFPARWDSEKRSPLVRAEGIGMLDADGDLASVNYDYAPTATYGSILTTKGYSSGKRQFELKAQTGDVRKIWLGAVPSTFDPTDTTQRVGGANDSVGVRLWDDSTTTGQSSVDGTTAALPSALPTPYTVIVTVGLDLDGDTFDLKVEDEAVFTAEALPVAAATWFAAMSGGVCNVEFIGTDLTYPIATYLDWLA